MPLAKLLRSLALVACIVAAAPSVDATSLHGRHHLNSIKQTSNSIRLEKLESIENQLSRHIREFQDQRHEVRQFIGELRAEAEAEAEAEDESALAEIDAADDDSQQALRSVLVDFYKQIFLLGSISPRAQAQLASQVNKIPGLGNALVNLLRKATPVKATYPFPWITEYAFHLLQQLAGVTGQGSVSAQDLAKAGLNTVVWPTDLANDPVVAPVISLLKGVKQ